MTIEDLRTVGPRLETTLVTPEMAAEWLSNANVGNRRLSLAVVNRYAADMRSGRWRHPTGIPIIFDKHGRIQDGQHRLAATVQSGVSIYFLIVFDAEPDDFKVLDQGKRRNAADILGMSGFTETKTTAAIARFSLLLSHYRDKSWPNLPEVTQQAVVAFAEAHRDNIAWAVSQGRAARSNSLLPESQYGAIACYVSIVSPALNRWNDFHARVCSGEMLREGDPEFALRRWAINRRAMSGSSSSQGSIAVMTKAWNAYVINRSVKMLVWRRHEMPMPEPLHST
jgi:hypothetical protein